MPLAERLANGEYLHRDDPERRARLPCTSFGWAVAASFAPLRADAAERAPTRLFERQIVEPRRRATLMAALPTLTTIDDASSRAVRAQYEQNPYPRWRSLPAIDRYPFARRIGRLFPHAAERAQQRPSPSISSWRVAAPANMPRLPRTRARHRLLTGALRGGQSGYVWSDVSVWGVEIGIESRHRRMKLGDAMAPNTSVTSAHLSH